MLVTFSTRSGITRCCGGGSARDLVSCEHHRVDCRQVGDLLHITARPSRRSRPADGSPSSVLQFAHGTVASVRPSRRVRFSCLFPRTGGCLTSANSLAIRRTHMVLAAALVPDRAERVLATGPVALLHARFVVHPREFHGEQRVHDREAGVGLVLDAAFAERQDADVDPSRELPVHDLAQEETKSRYRLPRSSALNRRGRRRCPASRRSRRVPRTRQEIGCPRSAWTSRSRSRRGRLVRRRASARRASCRLRPRRPQPVVGLHSIARDHVRPGCRLREPAGGVGGGSASAALRPARTRSIRRAFPSRPPPRAGPLRRVPRTCWRTARPPWVFLGRQTVRVDRPWRLEHTGRSGCGPRAPQFVPVCPASTLALPRRDMDHRRGSSPSGSRVRPDHPAARTRSPVAPARTRTALAVRPNAGSRLVRRSSPTLCLRVTVIGSSSVKPRSLPAAPLARFTSQPTSAVVIASNLEGG